MREGLGDLERILFVRLHNYPSDSLTNREYDYEKHSSGCMRMMRQALAVSFSGHSPFLPSNNILIYVFTKILLSV